MDPLQQRIEVEPIAAIVGDHDLAVDDATLGERSEERFGQLGEVTPERSEFARDQLDPIAVAQGVADLARELGLAGIVATNTTISREGLATPANEIAEIGNGGLSGAPVAARSLAVLQRLHARVGGDLALISVGGVETADQAYERIRAGASLVQGYTGLIYGGPFWMRRIHRGIAARLRADGFGSIADAVGSGSAGSQAQETGR